MTLKEFAGLVVKTAPLWGLGISALVAWLTARDTIKGKRPVKAVIVIVAYAAILLSLAFYSISP